MANGTSYSIEGTSWPFGTRKEALKEAKGVWKMYVTEYGSVNPLIGIYANRKKIGFVSKGLDGKFYFACGNNFHAISDYRVYEWGKFDSFTNLKCDYPDGGFRGWATIMPIRYGSRMKYYWLTFDRMLMSNINNWSYGNLYCFEAEGYFKA